MIDWTKDEERQLLETMDEGPLAIASQAAELLAARGGTMTAEGLAAALGVAQDDGQLAMNDIRQHIAAQGAAVAMLRDLADLRGAEIDRLIGERDAARAALARETANSEAWRRRVEKAADALADVATGEIGRLDLLGRIAALKVELKDEREERMRLSELAQVTTAMALRRARDEARARLPEGMRDCAIRFLECPEGHGRLVATNWIDGGCLVCQRDTFRTEMERRDVALATHAQLLEGYRKAGRLEHDRAEKAEAELAQLKREAQSEIDGKIALRRKYGARDDETWDDFLARLVANPPTSSESSGQVADDVDTVSAYAFETGDVMPYQKDARAALSRLAALAQQGQEALRRLRAIRERLAKAPRHWPAEGCDAALWVVDGDDARTPVAQPVDNAPWRCAAATCGHPDAFIPGHAERVAKASEAFKEAAGEAERRPEDCSTTFVTVENGVEGAIFTRSQMERYADKRAEEMRAACWEAIQPLLTEIGLGPQERERWKKAIEGAAP
jgi:hypothetical protein